MKPAYFDLSVKDLPAARRFSERVLGWRFERFPMPFEYYRITAGPPEEPGIVGGIGQIMGADASSGRPMASLTVPVPDLDQFTGKIKAAGGKVLETRHAPNRVA